MGDRGDKDQNLRNKIAKLLELAKSEANEHEAIAAAMKAQELLAKYELSEDDIIREEINDSIYEEQVDDVSSTYWDRLLAKAVADNFRCKCFLSYSGWGRRVGKVVFYGYTRDIAVATTTYRFLKAVAEKLWNTKEYYRCKDRGEKPHKASYMIGFARGVNDELSKNCVALKLVIPQEVESQFNQEHQLGSGSVYASDNFNSRLCDTGKKNGRDAVRSTSLQGTRAIGCK